MLSKDHWENVYSIKSSNTVSWFQEHAETSLALIYASNLAKSAAIIDIGGGASTLVDDLLHLGFQHLSVLDLSAVALTTAKMRLGEKAKAINWIEADITQANLPPQAFDLWHDRAAFHFLTMDKQRHAYKKKLLHALKPKGQLIVSTFAEDGPLHCSGLPVRSYSAEQLFAEFSDDFDLLDLQKESHSTPFATTQNFVYCHLQRK
ncbi:MAG: class I SAM-dependent methyltransferase [Pseudomonadota bacterium]